MHQVSLDGEGFQIVGKVALIGGAAEHLEYRYGLNTSLKVGSRIELEKHLVTPGQSSVGAEKDEMLKLTVGTGTTSRYETHFNKNTRGIIWGLCHVPPRRIPPARCSNAHVFNHSGQSWLSQYWVRRVSQQAYGGTNPNIGYGGHDEDQGQMGGVSALMKLGLFSLRGTCSKETIYEFTAPEFDEITIQLDPRYYSGQEFKIIVNDNSEENCYIQRAELNGRPLNNCWFSHQEFAQGGRLELWLGPKPNQAWGKSPVRD